MTPLPTDVARCPGAKLPECVNCYRRTSPPPPAWPWVAWWSQDGTQSPCQMFLKEPEE